MKKLKRQEQAQQQKDKEQDQTNNKNVKPVGGKGAGGGVSTGAGGGGNASIKKGQNTEGSKKKGGSSADNLAISLEKLWIEVNWLKRNKLDVAEFMRLRKGAGGVNGSIDIQEQNDAAQAKKDTSKKTGKKSPEPNSILQNLAMHFQYELSKSNSAAS